MTGRPARSEGRLTALRDLLGHVRDRLRLEVGFVLWDGSSAPADLGPTDLAISLADEGVVASLLRRPTLGALANLWVAGRIDLRGGTIFDLVRKRPKVRTRAFLRTLDKPRLLRTLAKFLLVPRGGPWPLDGTPTRRPSDGSEAANKQNVAYHYDLSNTFYAQFLDPQMVYTCAYFRDWENDLEQAQRDKLDMICRKLRLQPGETLLDIGSGWGGLVCHAAQHYGVHAHGVTLAEEQLAFAREKVARLGLQDRVTLELRDYALVEGAFDKIASIGMFEQVGIANHPTYFRTIDRLLKHDGLYLHHAIVRPAKRNDRRFRRQRPEYALLTRHIFPGGEVDHLGMSIANLERHGFQAHDVEGWREHYQRTCRHWHDRLLANYDAAAREVGPEKTRLWLVYLAACSIAFERGSIGIYQTLASKKRRGPSGLPPTRADLYR
jgi:cyclopropane-fatty-acyl-phospholipid synthase